jgi:hypothetical protein
LLNSQLGNIFPGDTVERPMADFDPYYQWLAIPPKDQPPNHYRLLGVELFESNADVIVNAAYQRIAHLRSFQIGKHSALSQKLLNEIAAAKICLLNRAKKDAYDRQLRQQSAPPAPPPAPAIVSPPTEDDLAFLKAPAITPRAIPAARPKQSSDKKQLWIGLGVVGGAAAVLLIVVLAVNAGRGGKEIASKQESSPTTAAPTAKKPVSPKPQDRPDEPPKEIVKARPSADSEKPTDTHPQKPAEPTPSPAGTTPPPPESNPKDTVHEPKEPSKGFFEEKPKPPEPEPRPKEKSGAADTVAPPKEQSQNPDASAKQNKKLAVPDEAALKQSLAMIRKTHKDGYRASDKAAFAEKLL